MFIIQAAYQLETCVLLGIAQISKVTHASFSYNYPPLAYLSYLLFPSLVVRLFSVNI